MNILHLSDFHCFENSEQHLREGYFEEYLSGLSEQILGDNDKPSLIVATGDFAHKNSTLGFDVAKKCLEKLCEIFELSADKVIVVPGNHDYERASQKSNEFSDARSVFNSKIRDSFSPTKNYIHEAVWTMKVQTDGMDVNCLCIDSTWGCSNCKPPQQWPDGTSRLRVQDAIIDWVKKTNPTDLLLVLSHYPIHLFDTLSGYDNEPDYAPNHLVLGLENLRRRIKENRRKSVARKKVEYAPTLWFHGDVHKPRISIEELHLYCIGGRLDSPSEELFKSGISRSARLLKVTREATPNPLWKIASINFEWSQETHVDKVDIGTWKSHREDEHLKTANSAESIETAASLGAKSVANSLISQELEPDKDLQVIDTANLVHKPVFQEIDNELSVSIVAYVSRNKLMRLERHPTKNGWERLTHVDLGPLMTDTDLVGVALQMFGAWLREKIPSTEQEVAIVGVDIWGRAIACDLGIRTGRNSVGITLRGVDDSTASDWFKADVAISLNRPWKHVVLVSDVVVTGETFQRAMHIMQNQGLLADGVNIYGLAMIAPFSPRFRQPLEGIVEIRTACSSIPFVVVPSTELPPSSVLRQIVPR